MKQRIVFSAIAAMSLAGLVSAQSVGIGGQTSGGGQGNNRLTVGSDAPKLNIREWIKGEKVEEFKEGQVYVVEFWATWCAPCRKSIPHLTKLQKDFGDSVIFIGISSENDVELIRNFVNEWGEKMEYRVAADSNQQTSRDWMTAAGQNGIPCAFVVGVDKKIAWIGNPIHPEGELDKVLAKVADGRYDPTAQKEAQPFLDQVDYAVRVQDWRVAKSYLDTVIAMNPYVFHKVAIRKFDILALDMGNIDEAVAYGEGDFAETYADDHETLAMLAKHILTDSVILNKSPEKLTALALRLSEQAYEASGTTEASIASAYAMALYYNGDHAKAVDIQRRAYLMAHPDKKAEHKRLLDQYLAGKKMQLK